MKYDVIIVGAGASGLTAGAFLTKYGRKILICEKQPRCGGLIFSYDRNGFVFDGGIRALENAGALFPMLKALDLELDCTSNQVSVGIEDRVISIQSDADLDQYSQLLKDLYPRSAQEIETIAADMQEIMRYMDIQYGIDNPLFLDPKQDWKYFGTRVLPWMFQYAATVGKVTKKNIAVMQYLRNFTSNQSLLDIIAQHFFTETPAFFALSYIKLYQDYFYPKGGTGKFTDLLVNAIQEAGGTIQTETEITSLNLAEKSVTDVNGKTYAYRQLIWAADQNALYRCLEKEKISDPDLQSIIGKKRASLKKLQGNDSVLTLNLSVDLDPSYFKSISAGHFFYTPSRHGQSQAGSPPSSGSWDTVRAWLDAFYPLTTYEISIPVLRDPAMAPTGKTGLIVSILFDYHLTRRIQEGGWYQQFKDHAKNSWASILTSSIYPELDGKIIDSFLSTPLTIQRVAGTTHGAITGWAFTNQPVPAENRLIRIASAIQTPIPNIYQSGQWTYSPSGFPVSLITGKLAADKVHKHLR